MSKWNMNLLLKSKVNVLNDTWNKKWVSFFVTRLEASQIRCSNDKNPTVEKLVDVENYFRVQWKVLGHSMQSWIDKIISFKTWTEWQKWSILLSSCITTHFFMKEAAVTVGICLFFDKCGKKLSFSFVRNGLFS